MPPGFEEEESLNVEADTLMMKKRTYVSLSIAEAIGELVANSLDERISPQ